MSLIRLILFFILFYAVYHILKLFIVNFRIGAAKKADFQKKNKPESKYENVEEAEFKEIKKKDENSEN